MNPQCILVHYHEIALKGDNRSWFENIFLENIKTQLNKLPFKNVKIIAARLFIFGIDSSLCKEYHNVLSNVMGVKNACLMSIVNLDENKIIKEALEQIKNINFNTFRISTKRQDKNFHLTSQDVNEYIGEKVLMASSKKVDLKNPDLNIIIELVNGKAYIGYKKITGYGGLPVRSGGKALSLISSGIDSPVASFLLVKRGVAVDYIHFNSMPSTSMQSINNVKKILFQLSKYQIQCNLYNIPLLEIQQAIMEVSLDKYWIVLFRRAMYVISNLLAEKLNIQALITGENVGQVASQTIPNIRATSDASKIPVLRPLSGMNKEEIINIATKIGTYNISIQPYEDCCSYFVPIHPITNANIEMIYKIESNLKLTNIYNKIMTNLIEEKISYYEK